MGHAWRCFSAPSFAAEPIKIGAFFALSGPAANIGMPTKLVAQMAADKINKEGGINGRPIELIVGDTESDPAKAAVIAKKFIFNDKVAAIIGPTSTAEGMSVKKIVEEAGVPIFMTVGGDPVIMGGNFGAYTYVFKSPQRSSTAAQKLYGYLKAKGLTKVALFTASDSFGKDGLGWLEKLAPEFGISFTAKESFGPSDTDMTAQLTKIKNTDAQAVLMWTAGPEGTIIAKEMQDLGMKIPLYGSHGNGNLQFIQGAGAAANGVKFPAGKILVPAAYGKGSAGYTQATAFITAYQAAYKTAPTTFAGHAFDAIHILADAAKTVSGDVTAAALRDAIEQTSGYVGIGGDFTFSPTDHNGMTPKALVMYEIVNGKWTLAK